MNTNASGYVLLSQGEYSDYQNTAFRVLKPFTFAETSAAFVAQWKPKHEWQTEQDPGEYIAWMSQQGFIEDAAEILELHVGGYRFNDRKQFTSDIESVVFAPKGAA